MADYNKPLPLADQDTEQYWQAAKEHALKAQKCNSCGRFRFPPQAFCPHCYSWEATWTKLADTGTVVSYVVVHQATSQAFADAVPLPIVKVEMDGTDGHVVITANVVDVPWDQVKVGMRVTTVYDDVTPEVTLPKFRPA
jgi:uncharacterized OB-fold protein